MVIELSTVRHGVSIAKEKLPTLEVEYDSSEALRCLSSHLNVQSNEKNRERRETMERLKTDMVEIGEGQKRIREGQREIRQKFEEIESECRSLKEETMNIAKQSDYNQVRINLMFSILKAREDNNFAHADHLTGLLRNRLHLHLSQKPSPSFRRLHFSNDNKKPSPSFRLHRLIPSVDC
ncbi:hypothetical protein NC651_004201 [Populus alba x Populus x berolinensis]|nr:hypothetical protein NC651_004201 [Populus alba x Populus x berolinensis]